MELSEHNGWENKLTWLVHLHLSNEQCLMNEIVDLVASTGDDVAAGRLVKQWARATGNGWVTGFPQRDTTFDADVRLLLWDVVGTALAYADWGMLVKLLMEQKTRCDNPFTLTLYRSITTAAEFQQSVQVCLQSSSSSYVAAETLQEWFQECVDEWFNVSLRDRQQSPAVLMIVHALIQDSYGFVCWEHVARAFRPE